MKYPPKLEIITILLILSILVGPSEYNLADNTLDSTEESNFDVTFLVPAGNRERIDWAYLIADIFRDIGIDVTVDVSENHGNRWVNHPKCLENKCGSLPVYDEGGYDLFFIGWADQPYEWGMDRRELVGEGKYYLFSNISTDSGFPSTDNRTINTLYDEYYNATDHNRRIELVKEMQSFFYNELPVIPIVNPGKGLMIYNRNGDFSQEEVDAFNYGWSVPYTYASPWANFAIADFDPLILNTGWGSLHPSNIPVLTSVFHGSTPATAIWQGLYERNHTNNFEWEPLLAEAMPDWNDDRTIATIKLKESVIFADGEPFTAHDVLATYRLHLTRPFSLTDYRSNYHHLTHVFDTNESTSMVDDYTVQFKLNQAKPFPMQIFAAGILPEHIYGNNTHPTLKEYNYLDHIMNDTIVNGSSIYGFGTGPYTYGKTSFNSYFNETNMYFNNSIVANENYWKGEVTTKEIIFELDFNGTRTVENVISGNTHFAYVDWWLDWYPEFPPISSITSMDELGYRHTFVDGLQMILVNQNHLVFGTGIETPLGKADPSRASEAARYVRQALSHLVPRQKIIDEICLGWAGSLATPVDQTKLGFDPSLNYEYSTSRAKELLVKAGYTFEENTTTSDTLTTSTTPSDPTEEEDNGFISSFSSLHTIIGLVVITIISYKKNKFKKTK
ncbi:MAG: ABC transporter substrate-binding protein [Candidatus Kariarchaeaceae archaeon]